MTVKSLEEDKDQDLTSETEDDKCKQSSDRMRPITSELSKSVSLGCKVGVMGSYGWGSFNIESSSDYCGPFGQRFVIWLIGLILVQTLGNDLDKDIGDYEVVLR